MQKVIISVLLGVLLLLIHIGSIYTLNKRFDNSVTIGGGYYSYDFYPFPYHKEFVADSLACSSIIQVDQSKVNCNSYSVTSSKGMVIDILMGSLILFVGIAIAWYKKLFLTFIALIIVVFNYFSIQYYWSNYNDVNGKQTDEWFNK